MVPLVPWPLSRLGRAIQPCAELAFSRPRCRWGGEGGGRVGTPPSLTLWVRKPIFRSSRWYRQNLSVAFWDLVSPFSAEWYGFGLNLFFCSDFFFSISKSQLCPKRFCKELIAFGIFTFSQYIPQPPSFSGFSRYCFPSLALLRYDLQNNNLHKDIKLDIWMRVEVVK